MHKRADKIIIGAGIYGLFATYFCAQKGEKVILLEYDEEFVSRATYINQARVHNGYHYPRSYSTAIKSAKYFNRFNRDFDFAINNQFEKIYATSKEFSWTSADQFQKFCGYSNIKCEEINPSKYFKENMVDGAFLTEEYTFDAMKIKDYYIEKLKEFKNVEIIFGARINTIVNQGNVYEIIMDDKTCFESEYILNATYASTNQISKKAGYYTFDIKYELCEIILCETSENIKDVGITVMDGPFFSVMPFGLTNQHSLTSVTFTPHNTSYNELPSFDCQGSNTCSPFQLDNCNLCSSQPKTAWSFMYNLSRKYLKEEIEIRYLQSLFSIKPILLSSEIDDSRPTVIKQLSNEPTFISVLSGKINTIYDLEEVL